ncbi:LysR family transcriptional regulator [Streptomyces sp. SID9727]|uniref:LysR substrate-binding domain-containing protein n=1 Tax=Streptomyces sp. SID9727 TaxID=2706114 RepID=UPI0013C62DBE|nr:LysR family transcriptional regulator [Streptomyces sp. SID9727]
MERYEIETFLALADELHFARTAERLGVTPGRVSQTIKALERRIGGALFERSSRHVRLTPVGRQLRDDVAPAYQRMQRAVADARAACAGIGEVLRIGFTAPWSGELLLRSAEAFLARNPRCTVEPHEVAYHLVVTALRERQIDVAVAVPPVDQTCITVGPVLSRERLALVVPASHALARRETVSLEDLALLPLVTASGMPQLWGDGLFPSRTPLGLPVEHGPTAGGWQGVFLLVAAGKGATIAPLRSEPFQARAGLVYVPFEDAAPVEYALMWRTDNRSAGLRALARTVADQA